MAIVLKLRLRAIGIAGEMRDRVAHLVAPFIERFQFRKMIETLRVRRYRIDEGRLRVGDETLTVPKYGGVPR